MGQFAYTLEDKAASDELRLKLNNLIEKEIRYREDLLQKLKDTAYKTLITSSIKGLKKLQQYGNESYNNFMLYYDQSLILQPNITPTEKKNEK